MKIYITCNSCSEDRLVETNGMLKSSYEKKYPRCHKCGFNKKLSSRTWFKKGIIPKTAFNKGQHASPNTEFQKGASAWNEGKPHMQDEKHPMWKGDQVGYLGIHTWISRKLGKPNKCEQCGTTQSKGFDWANISGEYKRDLKDWKRLCKRCHAWEHKNWEARWHVAI